MLSGIVVFREMPSINFKARFVPYIEGGSKRQTIRRTRKRPFRAGDVLYLFTGMRTKTCRRLGTFRCTGVHSIRVTDRGIEVDGRALRRVETDALARADGFKDTEEFMAFFRKEHKLPMEGQLIRW